MKFLSIIYTLLSLVVCQEKKDAIEFKLNEITSEFQEFISPACDRAAFIQNYLAKAGIECPVMQIEGKNHLYVKFPRQQYDPMFKIKTVLAHYDRIGCGANDNSAAVFCLLSPPSGTPGFPTLYRITLFISNCQKFFYKIH